MIHRSRSFLLVYICLLILSSDFVFAGSDTRAHTEEVFYEANQAYKEGRYQDAVAGYKKLVDESHGNGDVCFNLGNAYLRQDELGLALLNYERARLLIPRDADLQFNFRYAMDQRQDTVSEQKSLADTAFFWLDAFNLKELFRIFAAVNALLWLILLIRLFNRSDATYYILLCILLFWAAGAVSFGLKWYWISTDDRAVVLPKEADIMAGPDDKDTVLFKLHAGTVVQKERSEGGWDLVNLSGEKRGWVKSGSIEGIRR